MNKFCKLILVIFIMVNCGFAGESHVEAFIRVRDAAGGWADLSQIIIAPIIYSGDKTLSISGFGVIQGEDLAEFVRQYHLGVKEALPGYSDGRKIQLYFLNKNKAFSELDNWECWRFRDDIVVVIESDDGRVHVRIPAKCVEIINKNFYRNFR